MKITEQILLDNYVGPGSFMGECRISRIPRRNGKKVSIHWAYGHPTHGLPNAIYIIEEKCTRIPLMKSCKDHPERTRIWADMMPPF